MSSSGSESNLMSPPGSIHIDGVPSEPANRGRQKNYSPHEIETLCKCYVSVSENSIIGTDQSGEEMWKRITQKYNELVPHAQRKLRSLRDKYYEVSSASTKFNGLYQFVKNKNPSGANTEDILEQAQQLFKAKAPDNKEFIYRSGWEVLRMFPKWGYLARDLSMTANAKRGREESEEELLESIQTRRRPPGRDTSKKAAFKPQPDPLDELALAAKERNRLMQEHQDIQIMKRMPDTPEAIEYFLIKQKQVLAKLKAHVNVPPEQPTPAALTADNDLVFEPRELNDTL
jgi:hypothetical protein